MKKNYQTKEQIAMKLELESYKGYKELKELYENTLGSHKNETIIEDLKRVKSNVSFIEETLSLLPDKEKQFLYDVYINDKLSTREIISKYNLSKSSYHRYLDKAVYMFVSRVK